MTMLTRIALVGWLVALSLGMLAGSWPLEGPVVVQTGTGHGMHLGDVGVLLGTLTAAVAVLRARW